MVDLSWLDERITIGHWRTHDGDEVDFIIEFDDGAVLACAGAVQDTAGHAVKAQRMLQNRRPGLRPSPRLRGSSSV